MKMIKRWYEFKIVLMDAVDVKCMNLVEWAYKRRQRALRKWQELGGASEG